MLSSVGKLPFAIPNDIQAARQSIENHQKQQQIEKSHQQAHKTQKVLEQQQLAQMYSYDRAGERKEIQKAQGQHVDISV